MPPPDVCTVLYAREVVAHSLTPPERETVVLMDDASDMAIITTYQRPVITKLRRNPAACLVEEYRQGTSVGAKFELPAALVSFRTQRVKRELSDDERRAAQERARENFARSA